MPDKIDASCVPDAVAIRIRQLVVRDSADDVRAYLGQIIPKGTSFANIKAKLAQTFTAEAYAEIMAELPWLEDDPNAEPDDSEHAYPVRKQILEWLRTFGDRGATIKTLKICVDPANEVEAVIAILFAEGAITQTRRPIGGRPSFLYHPA